MFNSIEGGNIKGGKKERQEEGKGKGESPFPMGPLFCFLPNWEKTEGRGEKK